MVSVSKVSTTANHTAKTAKVNTQKHVSQPKAETKQAAKKQTGAQEPARHLKTVTVATGESLGGLAVKYHTTVSELAKLNKLPVNADLKIGQNLKVKAYNEKEYANYKKAKARQEELEFRKEEAQDKKQQAAQLKQNIARDQAQIQKARQFGLDKKYGMSYDKKTGNVMVKLRDSQSLAQVRKDFGIPKGVISQNNNMNQFESQEIGESGIQSYDLATAKKGTTIVVPAGNFNPQQEKGFFGKVAEFFGF